VIRYLAPPPRRPEGLVAAVFDQMRREFGILAEPLILHHPIPSLLAVTWVCLRETVLAHGRLPRALKEAVALAVSRANACPYCVDSHGIFLHALGEGGVERRLIAGEDPEDERLAAFATWAASSSTSGPLAAPFTPEERPEAMGTLCCFQYINRLATPLLGSSPLPAPVRWLRGPAVWMVGRALRDAASRAPAPGEALELVPERLSRDAGRWEHLGWADGQPHIAAAFAVFAEATEAAAGPGLSAEGRAVIREELARSRGAEPPLGREWLEARVEALGQEERPGVRLGLLVARAPHRVTGPDVEAFRQIHPGDAPLLGVLAWSAHEAAKEISTRCQGLAGEPVASQPRSASHAT